MDYFRKRQTRSVEDILFWKSPWNFSIFYFTPGNSRRNKAPTQKIPQIFLLLDLLESQGQKPRRLEIPDYLFLVTLWNCTSFLINPWKFHMLFLWYPWRFHILNPTCLIFFWNSPFSAEDITSEYGPLLRLEYFYCWHWRVLPNMLQSKYSKIFKSLVYYFRLVAYSQIIIYIFQIFLLNCGP